MTGVQTCALPIWKMDRKWEGGSLLGLEKQLKGANARGIWMAEAESGAVNTARTLACVPVAQLLPSIYVCISLCHTMQTTI